MKKTPQKSLTGLLSQVEAVTLAVYRTGGAQRAVDTEDVAVEAHRLAPGRFSWKKYPEQINLELVRVFLSDAKKGQYEMVIGSGRAGWRLTQRGLKWAKHVSVTMEQVKASKPRAASRSGSPEEQRWRRERSRILATRAWELWASGIRDIPAVEAKEVFRIDSYARGELREAKITRLQAMFADDQEVGPFLNVLVGHLEQDAT